MSISPAVKEIGRPICRVSSFASVSLFSERMLRNLATIDLRSPSVRDLKAWQASFAEVAIWRTWSTEWPGCSKMTSPVDGERVRTWLDIVIISGCCDFFAFVVEVSGIWYSSIHGGWYLAGGHFHCAL